MPRRLEQSTREHAGKFRRRIRRYIKDFSSAGLLTLFAAIFPTRLAVLKFESFLDRRFHVIVAVAFVFGRHSSGVQFPGGSDVITATAVVVGIFDVCNARGVGLHSLRSSRVALAENLVTPLFRQRQSDSVQRYSDY